MSILGIVKDNKIDLDSDNLMTKDNISIYLMGTIFNLNELRKEFNLTEKKIDNILYKLYVLMGIDFVSRLEGNFNLIIYDQLKKELYLVKDKLGNFPLYYYSYKDDFIFSDSLKSLINIKSFPKKINKQALANYMGYLYIPEPLTIFENTFKLEKGSILTNDFNTFRVDKYFNLIDEYKKTKKIKHSEIDLVKDYSLLFERVVQRLGNKDSQVGILMSSGKDSTLLAKLAANYYSKKVNTYTIAFKNERDESKEAKKIANYINSNHHTILFDDNKVKSVIKKLPKIYEEPFADPSIVPTTYLMDNIKDNNDFYITGDAVDELFLANDTYRIFDLKRRIKLSVKKIINIRCGKRVYKNFSEMAQNNVIGHFNYSDKLVNKKGQVYYLPKIDNKRFRSALGDLNNVISEKYRMKHLGPINYHKRKFYTPYYNEDIILKTFSIFPNKIYKKGNGKVIFDEVLFNYIPKEYYDSYRKKGFGIPLIDWLNRFVIDDIKKISNKEFILKQDLFNYDAIIDLLNEYDTNQKYKIAVVLWSYYVFQLWYIENVGDVN